MYYKFFQSRLYMHKYTVVNDKCLFNPGDIHLRNSLRNAAEIRVIKKRKSYLLSDKWSCIVLNIEEMR